VHNNLTISLLISIIFFFPALGAAQFNTPMYLPAITHMKRIGTGAIVFHLKGIHDPPYFHEYTISNCLFLATGRLACIPTSIDFNADGNDGEIRIKRVGSLYLYPEGKCSQDTCVVGFGDGMLFDEVKTQWHWDGAAWVEDFNVHLSTPWVHTIGMKMPKKYDEIQDTFIDLCNNVNEMCFSLHLEVK